MNISPTFIRSIKNSFELIFNFKLQTSVCYQRMFASVCLTLNSSLKSLLSSAMRRFISSSSLSTGMGGYFLFVLGDRANSGTLWSSAPRTGKEGGESGKGRGRSRRGREIEKWDKVEWNYHSGWKPHFNIHHQFVKCPAEGSVTQQRNDGSPVD